MAMKGQRTKGNVLATWFKAFYKGFENDFVIWFPYDDMDTFENPSGF